MGHFHVKHSGTLATFIHILLDHVPSPQYYATTGGERTTQDKVPLVFFSHYLVILCFISPTILKAF